MMSTQLDTGKVYDITYRCTTPGPEVEEGEIRAFWTGEIDTWGKYTLQPIDGDAPRYLFAHEISEAEEWPYAKPKISSFNLIISRAELAALAPELVDTLRELVGYGLCRQANTAERKSLAARYAKLAHDALKKFPQLKLNHANARTIIRGDEE
jgi:hypothetical protein